MLRKMLCKMLRKIFVQLTFGFGKRWCGDCEAQLEGGCERILVGGNSVVFIRRLTFSRFSSNHSFLVFTTSAEEKDNKTRRRL